MASRDLKIEPPEPESVPSNNLAKIVLETADDRSSRNTREGAESMSKLSTHPRAQSSSWYLAAVKIA